MPELRYIGVFGFGTIIGWFVYYVNRYRQEEVKLSDVGTLIGIIGGAAVTALFGEKDALFGAYGAGLFAGFFGYFITLLILVAVARPAFGAAWFLDGRRKKLNDDEFIPNGPGGGPERPPMIMRSTEERLAVLEDRTDRMQAMPSAYLNTQPPLQNPFNAPTSAAPSFDLGGNMSDENADRYCMCIEPAGTQGTKAALLNGNKWPKGSRITVKFVEGSPALRARVLKVAKEWTGPQMANLTFVETDDANANIRIAFAPGKGSWSYLGTYCQQIPKNQPTMNFGWLTDASSDDDVRRVVLHEFGHACGLIHEHQNPDHPIKWNRAAVIADLSKPPNSWNEATIENNMFKKYSTTEVTTTAVDPTSIMMYPIPKSWTLDGFSAGMNRDLSHLDKEFIRLAYPQ